MKLRLGYRTLRIGGQVWKGHEFHYSSIESIEKGHSSVREDLASVAEEETASVVEVTDAKGNPVSTPLYRYKNLIAGYTHLYWGEMNLMKLWE